MNPLIASLLLLLAVFSYSHSSSLQEALVLAGNDYEHNLSFDEAKNSEGIKRLLDSEQAAQKWQFFYFCETGKNNKTCGSWVDEKGNKIKGAGISVKRTTDGALLSKLSVKDAGSYTRVPENKDANQAYLERVHVNVQSLPPPPPKY
ncbi:unnamed protein product [Caenorhabditis sp. 36 PRJEB53466]|nr:unnamed protein product [Caenorhabditis sp. 36 PRJEB53466]